MSRVRAIVETPEVTRTITYYPFPNYEETLQQEWQGSGIGFGSQGGATWVAVAIVERKSYLLKGQVVAIRVTTDPAAPDDGLYFLHNDHLNSTSLLTDESGQQAGSTIRYYPYGDYRTSPTTGDVTDRGFTGHRHNDGIGMIYMRARYYVPGVGRFASADTIVPDLENPQSFNRYSYTLNNPAKYTDPSGHCIPDEGSIGSGECKPDPPPPQPPSLISYPFVMNPTWLQWFGDTDLAEFHTYAYCGGYHCGFDFGAPWGTPVHAGVYREVIAVWCPDCTVSDQNGNQIPTGRSQTFSPWRVDILVTTRDGEEYVVIYGHLNPDVLVRVGDDVTPDTVIGAVGNPTGNPEDLNIHVHIEITDWRYTYNLTTFFSIDVRNRYLALAFRQRRDPAELWQQSGVTFNSGGLLSQPYQYCRTYEDVCPYS